MSPTRVPSVLNSDNKSASAAWAFTSSVQLPDFLSSSTMRLTSESTTGSDTTFRNKGVEVCVDSRGYVRAVSRPPDDMLPTHPTSSSLETRPGSWLDIDASPILCLGRVSSAGLPSAPSRELIPIQLPVMCQHVACPLSLPLGGELLGWKARRAIAVASRDRFFYDPAGSRLVQGRVV